MAVTGPHRRDEALGPVVITTREIYDAVRTLTGRVDVLIAQDAVDKAQVADHESRIRRLERARWPLPTVTTLLSAAAVVASLWHHY